jgi:hypothetical protein
MSKTKLQTTRPEIINPYHPYDLEWGTWFYHDDVLQQIKKRFESHNMNNIILIHGRLGLEKTLILKKIGNSPGVIGEKYIPIYLDLRKFINFAPDELLFYIASEVIEKLKIRGYAIPTETMRAYGEKKVQVSAFSVESALLTLDSYIENKVLLLVLDEFDELLKHIGTKPISDYIQYFRYIEKNWRNYALLIGVKYWEGFTNNEVIQQFLDSTFKINLEEKILEEEDLRTQIVEPIEGQLSYSENSIRKIIWYSGKNLYFQQLICYFLIPYIDEKGKKHCFSEDVETVILQILAHQKDKFNTTWDIEISIEMRLIASALADERITEKRSHLYYLTENQLLNAIFGDQISKKIEELHDFGFINEMHGRHFTDFPFKIPLFGLFIQKEHPFIKTIVESIDAIADRIELPLLIQEVANAPADQLSLFDKDAIVDVADEWVSLRKSIQEKKRAPEKGEIEGFFKSLSKLLNLKMKITDKEQSNENYIPMDIKNLNIGILEEAFCFIQTRPEITKSDIFHIENRAATVVQDTKTKLSLYFYFQSSNLVDSLVKKTYLNLIAIEESDLTRILFCNRPQDTFRRIILSRLSLQYISPYQTHGPARATFYGRSEIINRIIGSPNTSFAIVGARRIGKSSLLHKINDNPSPCANYILMNLEIEFYNVKNYNKFLKSLVEKIEERFNKKVNLPLTFGRKIKKLLEIINKLSLEGKKIRFIFDEIDGLLEVDKRNNYQLMKNFRSMSQNRYCQFIFAGFKELYHTKRHFENPMYHFCEEIIMDPLDEEASLDLITKPMESIGIHYHRNEDRELILEYTARHPNLIQFFCKQLVDKVGKHPDIEERRTIFKNDIENLFDNEYQNYIMDEVYMFFSDLSPINRLILMLLVEPSSDNRTFSINEVKGFLMDHGIDIPTNDVHRNLRELVVRFILVDDGKNYRFALAKFPDILKEKIDMEFKNKTIKEIKSNAKKSL